MAGKAAVLAILLLLSSTMPRAYKEAIPGTSLPQQRAAPAALSPTASPVNTMVAQPVDEFSILADSLGKLSPGLARVGEQIDRRGQHDASKAGEAAAARTANPKSEGAWEPPLDPNIPTAYRESFADAYRKGIAKRNGVETAQDFLDAYNAEAQKPDFNFEQFSASFRQSSVAGLADPDMVTSVGGHLDQAIASARGVHRQEQQRALVAERNSSFSAELTDYVVPGNLSETNQLNLLSAIDRYAAAGGTRAEAVALSVAHIAAESTQAGGAPELFDVLELARDSKTGRFLLDLNPQLKDTVASAKKAAERQLAQTLSETTFEVRSETKADLFKSLDDGAFDALSPAQVRAKLLPLLGKGNVFDADGDLAAFEARVWDRQARLGHSEADQAALASRRGYTIPEARQKAAMERILSPIRQAFMEGRPFVTKEGNEVDPVSAFLAAHEETGVSYPDPIVKQFLEATLTSLPEKGAKAVPQDFAKAAALYSALKRSGNHALLAQYSSDKLADVMDSYLADTRDGQVPAVGAYINAFAAIDPERRKIAADFLNQPGMRARLASKVTEAVEGWRSWVPKGNFLGVSADPSPELLSAAEAEARRWLGANPSNAASLGDHLESWATRNAYHDSASNRQIMLPPTLNDELSKTALTEWIGGVKEAYADRGINGIPRLNHRGDGAYALGIDIDGVTMPAGDVSLVDIRALHQAKTNLMPEDLKTLGTLRSRLLSGTATSAEVEAAKPAIDKADRVGVWDGDMKRRVAETRSRGLAEAFKSTTGEALKAAALPDVREVARRVEAPAARVALGALKRGDFTSALIASNEGMRLTAYSDSSGRAIGFGYNITANGETAKEDFRRAGIPPEHLEAVRDGKMAITEEQAIRLLHVVLPRYAAGAKRAVEAREPGAWARLSEQQRAVLTDVAYQGGAGNLNKMDEGIKALLAGDATGDKLTLQIKNGGARVPDTRRTLLRRVMLSGSVPFRTLVSHASIQPANAVERRRAVSAP